MNTQIVQSRISITPRELHHRMTEGLPVELLDVRTPAEHAVLHVSGARLLPLDKLDAAAFLRKRGNSNTPLYVICQSGPRAAKAADKFQRAGFEGCVQVEGGIEAWVEAGLPVERGERQGVAADASGADYGGHCVGRRCGAGTGRKCAVCHHPADHGLRSVVRGAHRFLRTGVAAGQDAVESPGLLRCQFLL